MLILPSSQVANGTERACTLLSDIARQRVHCSLLVLGDGDRPREIASRADVRAESAPYRKTVWIPDLTTLAGKAEFEFILAAADRGAEAIAVSLRFVEVYTLRGDDAIDFYRLEKAFTDALAA